jgi:hypothetical protein
MAELAHNPLNLLSLRDPERLSIRTATLPSSPLSAGRG